MALGGDLPAGAQGPPLALGLDDEEADEGGDRDSVLLGQLLGLFFLILVGEARKDLMGVVFGHLFCLGDYRSHGYMIAQIPHIGISL